MHKTLSDVLSSTLKPLCPRDSHAMHYEAKGIHWKNDSEIRGPCLPIIVAT